MLTFGPLAGGEDDDAVASEKVELARVQDSLQRFGKWNALQMDRQRAIRNDGPRAQPMLVKEERKVLLGRQASEHGAQRLVVRIQDDGALEQCENWSIGCVHVHPQWF